MATTSPARIDDDLYASAKLAGDALSRSAAQQVAHWARIGREIEAAADINHRAIVDVLAGSRAYDHLDAKEQAVVRSAWAERMAVYREALDLPAQFAAAGRSWVELDERGAVTERRGTPKRTTASRAAAVRAAAPPRRATTRVRTASNTESRTAKVKPGGGAVRAKRAAPPSAAPRRPRPVP
jgi:hypothetical protein